MRFLFVVPAFAVPLAAYAAPPHYRIISPYDWTEGPATVLENGDVVYEREWSSLARWSRGETTPIVVPGQMIEGFPVQFDFSSMNRWAVTGDGAVFAPCTYSRQTSPFGGLLAILPGKAPSWWLQTGDDIPRNGKWVDTDRWGIAPSNSMRTFVIGYSNFDSDSSVQGENVFVSLEQNDSARGRRVELLARQGDATPDGGDQFRGEFFEPAFKFVLPDEHGRCMLIAHVRSEPIFWDSDGRETLWRWTESTGLERLLDPKVPNVDGWAASPIFNAWMSRGGAFAIFVELSKPGEVNRNAILVFDDFETKVPRIAVMEGEELAQGKIGRLLRLSINDSGSIAFQAQLVLPGESKLDQRVFIYHRTKAGVLKLAHSPLGCDTPDTCQLGVFYDRSVELANDERVFFNALQWTGGDQGLYVFDAKDGDDGRLSCITSLYKWNGRFYPALIGGAGASPTLRTSNSKGRIALGGGGSIALFDPSITPCPPDLTCDGQVDIGDFYSFFPQYDIMDCAGDFMTSHCDADFNHDGFVDDADFSIFAAAYDGLGCPTID